MYVAAVPNYVRQKLIQMQEKINEFTVIAGDCKTPESEIDWSSKAENQ